MSVRKPPGKPAMGYEVKGTNCCARSMVFVTSFALTLPWVEEFHKHFDCVTVMRRPMVFS